jgi:hypothetical protein
LIHNGLMVQRKGARRALVARALLGHIYLLIFAGTALGACGLTTEDPNAPQESSGGGSSVATGGSSAGGSVSTAGAPSSGGSGDFEDGGTVGHGDWLGRDCDPPPSDQLSLEAHVVQPYKSRIFYTWTTEDQEKGLREGDPLYSVGEVPGKGRGRAADVLFDRAKADPDSLSGLVAPFFDTCRYGWPHPWPTRFGVGGEQYGDKLVRITLKPQAWVARLDPSGEISSVYDQQGAHVPFAEAMAHPERIGALYFVYFGDPTVDDWCGSFGPVGPESYREFVLGNADMVERYEVGTEAILSELDDSVRFLKEYRRSLRGCTEPSAARFFELTACGLLHIPWYADAYIRSLALPGPAYLPTDENLAALIDSLESVRFEPEPFVLEEEP